MNGFPFGQNPQNGGIPFIAFDPMAGFKADEKMADNVTAGEVSKFVGKNTNYFMRVFGSILRTNKSRFSFVSAILPGAYMLYRKMYAIGIVISVIVVGLLAGTLIIQLSLIHISEPTRQAEISYAVFCLKKKKKKKKQKNTV